MLPAKVFLKINKGYPIARSNVLLKGFGNVLTTPIGQVKLLTETQYGKQKECEYLISKEERRPLLGIEACSDLNLVKGVEQSIQSIDSITTSSPGVPESKEKFIEKYRDIFDGLGDFGTKVKIVIDPTIRPGGCLSSRFNFSITSRLKGKLADLEQRGVIA